MKSLYPLLGALSFGLVACGGPPEGGTFRYQAPGRSTFPLVGDVLAQRCGSLDCHGSLTRNLRIWGTNGLRVEHISGFGSTTNKEYDLTYRSVISIQPEVLADIASRKGQGVEEWIVIAKGRNTIHHKGKEALVAGDAAEKCIVSWIAGKVDEPSCQEGERVDPPEEP